MENNIENEQFHTEIGLNTAFLHGVAGSQFPILESVKPLQTNLLPGWSSVVWGAGFKPVGGESRSGSIPPHRRTIFRRAAIITLSVGPYIGISKLNVSYESWITGNLYTSYLQAINRWMRTGWNTSSRIALCFLFYLFTTSIML